MKRDLWLGSFQLVLTAAVMATLTRSAQPIVGVPLASVVLALFVYFSWLRNGTRLERYVRVFLLLGSFFNLLTNYNFSYFIVDIGILVGGALLLVIHVRELLTTYRLKIHKA